MAAAAEKRYVKPGTGTDGQTFVTINPATKRPLSPDGEWVELNRTTRRRLADGDWVDATPPDRPESVPPRSHGRGHEER